MFFILAAFAQSSFLNVNLVLILLLCRSLAVTDNENYLIGFGIGVLLGVLSFQNIGFWPLAFLVVIKLIYIIKRLPISFPLLTSAPLLVLFIVLIAFLESFIAGLGFDINKVLFESALVLPGYFLVRLFEDRFVAINRDIKLKMRR